MSDAFADMLDAVRAEAVTLPEMIEAARSEASRIEIVQRDLVDSGLRAAPDSGQLRRMYVFERMIYVLDLCRSDRAISTRLRAIAAPAKTAVAAPPPAGVAKEGS